MGRIRTVKPEIAKHEVLFDAEADTTLPLRFAWVMLFTVADREGRFQWQPRRLKADILPYDDLDFSRVLDAWLTRGLVVKYRVGDAWIGWIPTFRKHQVINNREAASELPDVSDADEVIDNRNKAFTDACPTREVHAHDEGSARTSGREGKGREGKESADAPLALNGHPASRRFTPPSLEEVSAYIRDRGSPIDPEAFIAYYTARGWKLKTGLMSDWRAAVITWEKRHKAEQAEPEQRAWR